MTTRNRRPHTAPLPEAAPGTEAIALVAGSMAFGLDVLHAEMQALAAILPGQSRPEVPGEGDFDDLPV